MIDVSDKDLIIIKDIIKKYVPDCKIWAFGSRVNGTAKPYSDLDLAITCKTKIPRRTMILLKEEFEESSIPFRVDVTDWHSISNEFKEVIKKQYEVIKI